MTVAKSCAQGCPDGQFLPKDSLVCLGMFVRAVYGFADRYRGNSHPSLSLRSRAS